MRQERNRGIARHLVWLAAALGCGSSGGEEGGPPGIATAVSAGATGACALVSGAAQCWGDNSTGRLANGGPRMILVPVRVTGLATDVSDISMKGILHACAVVRGAAQCWGANYQGVLGDGTMTDSPIPVPVSGLTSGVTAVSAGGYYACAIGGGALECWGDNSAAQLGTDTPTAAKPTPIALAMFPSGVTAISTGGDHACAVMNSGAFCWGNNSDGRLGAGYPILGGGPFPVEGLSAGVSTISAGYSHSCAVVDGGAWCWGSNQLGNLGNSSVPVGMIAFVPVPVDGLSTGVTAISAAGSTSCAIVNGGVQCWGSNARGKLGNNSTTDSPIPVAVQGLEAGATAISVGDNSACAVVNGGVSCWGDNSLGQLGDGTQRGSLVPVAVKLR